MGQQQRSGLIFQKAMLMFKSGIIDFLAIFKAALNQGIDHFSIEHDTVKDGMACLKSSGAYLRNLIIQ